ncbi:MAG: response regulator [Methylomarinum sp.]|nr:response regulator [Methylomarinum sp.]
MSGYDVLKTLKQSEFLKHIPVIFITASDFDNVTDYILDLDDDAVSAVLKPFNFKSLLGKIDYFLWSFPEPLSITIYSTQSQSS